MKLNPLIKNLFRYFSIEITRYNPSTSHAAQLAAIVKLANVNLILDIGANTGQFVTGLLNSGYKGKIISFEPLSSAREMLLASSQPCNNWTVHEQAAIGDCDGQISINISGNSVSSSVLPMLDSHKTAAKNSSYIDSELVKIKTLDSALKGYPLDHCNILLKIDTQGYEWQVLDGATNTLDKVSCILCEISLVPLYEGQRLWRDIIDRLESSGFKLWALQEGFKDPETGQLLQMDAIFIRSNLIPKNRNW